VFPKYSYEDILTEIISICSGLGILAEIKAITETERYKIQNQIDKAIIKSQASLPSATQNIKITNRENEFQVWLNHYSDRGYNKKQALGGEKYYLEKLSISKLPLDKHNWLRLLTQLYFVNREIPGFIEKCIESGIKAIDLYSDCISQYNAKNFESQTSEVGDQFWNPKNYPHQESNLESSFVNVVKMVTTVFEKLQKYDRAIELLESAIRLGIKDTTTKGGLERRLTILRKKL
jgi:hypothetical protein